MENHIFITCLILVSTGCVGPMTPFGATGALGPRPAENVDTGTALAPLKLKARVRFTPERQVLHGASLFSVILEDPEGVPENYRLQVSYNGIDVTRAFQRQAETIALDPLRHGIKLTAHSLRLPAAAENKVKVVYWRAKGAQPVVAHYLPPVCSMFTATHMVLTVPEFEPSLSMIQLINQHAMNRKINPYLVAALVAQESAFNASAISTNRAIGLTQVTPLGESEVIKHFASWPRYPGASEMSFAVLKLAVLGGQIHSGNEWRLDPSLSIQGGVEYLSYLNEYWSRPDKRAQVERRLGPSETALTEVLLASYNSGATRVSNALDSDGDHYLQNEELAEANKYVRRVVSYCDHFEHQEE